MTKAEEFLTLFKNINSWKKGGIRAPHKPLLILIAIGKVLNGEYVISYKQIEEKLTNFLIDFGPSRKNNRPYYPFVRLANDNIWKFDKPELIDPRRDYPSAYLIDNKIKAGFSNEIIDEIRNNRKFTSKLISYLLENNFPDTLHSEILNSVNLNEFVGLKKYERDPEFRENIRKAYQSKCAICNYSIRVRDKLVGLEAAHIKWLMAGGSNETTNGLLLCSMHHILLDMGAYTIDKNYRVEVSESANGERVKEWLHNFHGKEIYTPFKSKYYPDLENITWHVNEVYKQYGTNN